MFSNYPKTIKLKDDRQIVIHPMDKSDGEALKAYFQSLRFEDKLYMRDDVSDPKVIQKWIDELDYINIVPLVAVYEGKIVGVASLHRNSNSWDSHVGHIRVSVTPKFQGSGLGFELTREIFIIAQSMHIDIGIAEMPKEHKSAIHILSKLGFTTEHIFKDHVRDRKGIFHDLVVMRIDIKAVLNDMLDKIREWEDKGG
jgi:RimJ/RimL family protein N-acetyltransferase